MFTFKTDKPTGKWKSFRKSTYHIKIKRKCVGYIDEDAPHRIGLRVIKKDLMEDKNPNCDWKWIRLKKEFTSVNEAKTFLQKNYEAIIKKFNLKMMED